MGLLLPKAGYPGCTGRAEDPWDAGLRERRARAFRAITGKLRGAGTVCSGERAVWIPPRIQIGDPLEDLAIRLDAAAVRLAKGRGALDLAVGEALELLFQGGRLDDLGWTRQVDFAREALGIPPRTMYAFLELARAVAGLPELRLAVVRGDVTPLKARSIAAAIRRTPRRGAFLIHLAATRSLPDIESILEDLGEEVPKDPLAVRSKRFRMTTGLQGQLDRAIELAKAVVGHGKARFVYEEVIAMEYLAAHSDLAPEPGEGPPGTRSAGSTPPSPAQRERLLAEWEGRDTREIEAALHFLLSGERDLREGKPVETNDPWELETLILRLLSFRKRWDAPFGRILETISTLRLHSFLGYANFSRYAKARLGISERAARQRVWLERKMEALPTLRMALVTGRLTYSKALVVAKDATREDVARRILEAARTSCQQAERKSAEEEDRQNLAAGVRRIWGPEEAIETIEAAIAAAKRAFYRETGLRIGDGEAYGIVAACFVDEWQDPVRRKRLSPLRRKVHARTKGICAAPGCGNPAEHMHHIVYRSNGGPDEAWNCVFLCFRCHRRIHGGRMQVRGRAGERLYWRIARGGGRWTRWETVGSDDVVRMGEEGSWPPGSGT